VPLISRKKPDKAAEHIILVEEERRQQQQVQASSVVEANAPRTKRTKPVNVADRTIGISQYSSPRIRGITVPCDC